MKRLIGDLRWAWPGMSVWEAATEAATEAAVPPERLRQWVDLVSDDLKAMAVTM